MRPCFHGAFPLEILVHARIHALRAARARGRCSVLYVHACVRLTGGPHQSQFRCPLKTRTFPRIEDNTAFPRFHRDIERIDVVLPNCKTTIASRRFLARRRITRRRPRVDFFHFPERPKAFYRRDNRCYLDTRPRCEIGQRIDSLSYRIARAFRSTTSRNLFSAIRAPPEAADNVTDAD